MTKIEYNEDKAKALGEVFAYLSQYSECNLLPYIETNSEPFNDVRPIGYDAAAKLIPEDEREGILYGPVTDPLGRALLASNGFNIDTLIQRATGATRAALEKWKTDNTRELRAVTVEDDIKNRPELMAMARRFAAMRISEMEQQGHRKDRGAALELEKITGFDESVFNLYAAPLYALIDALEEIRAGKDGPDVGAIANILVNHRCIAPGDAKVLPEHLKKLFDNVEPAAKLQWIGTWDKAGAFKRALKDADYSRFNRYFHKAGKSAHVSTETIYRKGENSKLQELRESLEDHF